MSEGFNEEPYGQSERKDEVFPLQKRREQLDSSKQKKAFKRLKLVPDNTIATTTYEDSEILDLRLYERALVHIINLDPEDNILYKVLATLDVNWKEIKSETTILPNASAYETLTDAWAFFKIQYKTARGTANIKILVGVKS